MTLYRYECEKGHVREREVVPSRCPAILPTEPGEIMCRCMAQVLPSVTVLATTADPSPVFTQAEVEAIVKKVRRQTKASYQDNDPWSRACDAILQELRGEK